MNQYVIYNGGKKLYLQCFHKIRLTNNKDSAYIFDDFKKALNIIKILHLNKSWRITDLKEIKP